MFTTFRLIGDQVVNKKGMNVKRDKVLSVFRVGTKGNRETTFLWLVIYSPSTRNKIKEGEKKKDIDNMHKYSDIKK